MQKQTNKQTKTSQVSYITTRNSVVRHGLKLSVWGFKITVVCQVHMSPASSAGLSVKINTHKTPHDAQRSWTYLLPICFCMCGRQKSDDPPIWTPSRDKIKQCILGSLLYICDQCSFLIKLGPFLTSTTHISYLHITFIKWFQQQDNRAILCVCVCRGVLGWFMCHTVACH